MCQNAAKDFETFVRSTEKDRSVLEAEQMATR